MLKQIKAAKNIHVVGVSGTEGAAVALFLTKLGLKYTAHDFSEEAKFQKNFLASHLGYSPAEREKTLKVIFKNSSLNFKENYLKEIESADLVFVSQNWEAYSPNQKLRKIFAKNPRKFMTITQLYFGIFPGKILAVTGTNGKSTTTKLIAEIMFASRQPVDTSRQLAAKSAEALVKAEQRVDSRVYFTGNDRRNIQILDQFDKWKKSDWLVIEVSNRQLKFPLGRAPEIGVITNVTPNHVDEYIDGFSAYKKGKFALVAGQKNNDICVLNYDNIITHSFAKKVKSRVVFFSAKKKLSTGLSAVASAKAGVYIDAGWIVDKNQSVDSPAKVCLRAEAKVAKVCLLDKVKLIGEHNFENVLAAVAATRAAGVSAKIICQTIEQFRGIPQRLEVVFEKNGVKFINDSASTTPESTIAALQSFPKKSVNLIAGGESKGMDFAKLAREIRTQKTRVILLESPLAKSLANELRKLKVGFEIVKDLRTAVELSARNAQKGDIVLLSPAGAWFCYFSGKIPLGGRGFEQFAKALA
ncbi:MAG: Mur ligase family protein [Patescibacteria group bacterium]